MSEFSMSPGQINSCPVDDETYELVLGVVQDRDHWNLIASLLIGLSIALFLTVVALALILGLGV